VRAISDIRASSIADVVLVVQAPPAAATGAGPTTGSGRDYSHALYSLYTAVDGRLFGSRAGAAPRIRPPGDTSTDDALAEADITELVGDVPRVSCTHSGSLSADELDRIVFHRLDVVVSFGASLPKASREIARCGVWSFRHGDDPSTTAPPAFWEVMEASPVTASTLQVSFAHSDCPLPLVRSFSSTDHYSVTRNQDNVLWTSAAFVRRALGLVHQGTAPSPDRVLAAADVVVPFSHPRRQVPTNAQMCVALSRHGGRVVWDRIRHQLFPERWVLAFHRGSGSPPMHRFTPLLPPEGRKWADPFPVLHEGEHYLFFEEQYGDDPAHLAVMKLGADGRWGDPAVVLAAPHHLSYPHVFRWNDSYYMVPESLAAGRVELYRCTEFPHVWELDRVLLDDFRGVDPTVFEVDGRWWLFVNSAADGARNCEELHLFSAEAPTGPWKPHAHNPVRSDARDTRPAGRLFTSGGRLLRPAQDCGGRYGRAVVMNEVLRLDDDGFEEREVGRIEPDWSPDVVAVHTFNAVPGLTVVDCLRREFRLRR
jgi:hypothetical protein